jgi:nitroreductase
MRIDSCPMEGFKPAEVDKVLKLDEMGLRSVLLCPVGYRSSEDVYADKPKVRFTSEEIIKTLS